MWRDCKTQLRAGGSGVVGLDYAEARQSAREFDIPWTRAIKRKLQVLENEMLKAIKKQTAKGDA